MDKWIQATYLNKYHWRTESITKYILISEDFLKLFLNNFSSTTHGTQRLASIREIQLVFFYAWVLTMARRKSIKALQVLRERTKRPWNPRWLQLRRRTMAQPPPPRKQAEPLCKQWRLRRCFLRWICTNTEWGDAASEIESFLQLGTCGAPADPSNSHGSQSRARLAGTMKWHEWNWDLSTKFLSLYLHNL